MRYASIWQPNQIGIEWSIENHFERKKTMKQTVKDLQTGDKIELDYLLELICSIKETSIEHDNAVLKEDTPLYAKLIMFTKTVKM